MYGPELSILLEPERAQLLIGLDILTAFERWGRMREDHGLSIEAARDVWIDVIGRLLFTAGPLNRLRLWSLVESGCENMS
ncbi:hypothetical protein RSO01_93530 [Reyranella soli]|uniref:Uncharacterized protein n=1 Tax=Reyranella soli TaxID=1230389 RepID=A0A512NT98_9HYPH|nr:hypothetical protein RSO01_93530 [Reyranella soli]